MTADLHIHTTASDGLIKPEEVALRATEKDLTTISITDHDTTAGVKPAQKKADKLPIRVISGVEINTEYGDEQVHILGYFIDEENKFLQDNLQKIRQGREERARKMISSLQKSNLPVKFFELKELVPGKIISRSHIADLLVYKGIVNDREEAFEFYLHKDSPHYCKRDYIDIEKAVKIIEKAGGIPILAHPGLIDDEEVIIKICSFVQGLEVFYPDHSLEDLKKFKTLARNRDLIITGGSDFHGPNLSDEKRLGSIKLKDRYLKKLESRAA